MGRVRNSAFPGTFETLEVYNILHIDDVGHSTPEQCTELVKRFTRIEDPLARDRVLDLVEDLAAQTGELLTIDDLINIQ